MTTPIPEQPPDELELVHPLTFFVSATLRRRLLGALREFDADRVRALCLVLGIDAGAPPDEP